MDFCTRRVAWMPVADCSVEAGRKLLLRRKLLQRTMAATNVAAVVQGASAPSNTACPFDAASAQVSTVPEAKPMRMKLATVLQCAHSWIKRRQA